MTGVSFEPVLWWPLVAAGACVALAAVLLTAARQGRALTVRRTALVLLTAIVLLGPHAGTVAATVVSAREVEVVVALDRTASMAVRDAGSSSRLEQAVADVTDLADALDAPLTVVTWGGSVRQRVPATTDDDYVSGLIQGLEAEPPATGSGSRIDQPLATLRAVVARAVAGRPDRSVALLVLSDGENTAGGRASSFASLAEQVDRALVVGYGTDDGGPVPLGPDQPDAYVPDPDGTGPAVSRRDGSGLLEVAGQLDGEYRNREDLSSTSAVTDLLRPAAATHSAAPAPADVTWLAALALLALLAFELRGVARQWREVRIMRRRR